MPLLKPAPSLLEFSVVIPIYNEKENLPELHRRLTEALAPMALGPAGLDYEILFVDDSSRDGSTEIIARLAESDPHVRSLRFSRNFGHQTAISAGMQHAAGKLVALMDGDLQDPPEILPKLIEKQRAEGYDVIFAVRRRRKENIFYRAAYSGFYRILKRLSYIDIPLDSGDFCLMRRRVVEAVNALPERNRFVRGLRSWVGFRQTGMEYERAARNAGEAKYTFRRLLGLALDGIVSFSYLPLRFATWIGFGVALAGFGYAAVIAARRLYLGRLADPGWSTLVVAVMVLGGVQMMLLGAIGEYIGRIFEETKRRPQYIVERYVGYGETRGEAVAGEDA